VSEDEVHDMDKERLQFLPQRKLPEKNASPVDNIWSNHTPREDISESHNSIPAFAR
jgi:hypothetical protein